MSTMTGDLQLPTRRDLFYGGAWAPPVAGQYRETTDPATAMSLGQVADAGVVDVDRAVASARDGFTVWSRTPPQERARVLRAVAAIIREHSKELALIDAVDCGNPVAEMGRDVAVAADHFEFFAGLVTEIKGASIPMGPDVVNFSVRQPFGVVARIVAFNHPFMFSASKAAAPLAAGNAVIIKPPEQAPLSALRLAELVEGLFPPGVFNVLTGGRVAGEALAEHPGVNVVTLIGSVPTGRAVMSSASKTLKPTLLELGGKNAIVVYPDTDPVDAARGIVGGMNFSWCGQSCGSTSRAFVHQSIHDAVLAEVKRQIGHFKPGIPADPKTTMGAMVSRAQLQKALDYIRIGQAEGAHLLCGGTVPTDAALRNGNFLEPTVFHGVTQSMRIAREEIFGPVLSVLQWSDEQQMIADVNSVEYGLTCAIWTNDLSRAHRLAMQVEAGFVWINEVSKHFPGVPFGGSKQSGNAREEGIGELIAFTQEKNIHIRLRAPQ